MEVHHHPHVEKKNFKEYFLEFLMIFLAVTLGFFAENLREHFAEQRQQKDYISSFYEDLKTDTAQINEVIKFDKEKINGLNNITDCFDTVSEKVQSSSCLGNLLKYTARIFFYHITKRTIQQLNSAGGFRLLQKEDADSIIKYESEFDALTDFQAAYQQRQDNMRSINNKLINFKALTQLYPVTNKRVQNDTLSAVLNTNNDNEINEYFNEMYTYYGFTNVHLQYLQSLKNEQTWLILFFRNKYHFK